MNFLSGRFWHLKKKMHKDFKKITRSEISENLEKGNFYASQMSFRSVSYFFSDDSFQCYYNIGTLKRRGHRTFFSCKSFRESSDPHARSRAFKNPDSIISTVVHDLLRLPLTIACARASSHCIRSDVQKRLLLRKSFSSR